MKHTIMTSLSLMLSLAALPAWAQDHGHHDHMPAPAATPEPGSEEATDPSADPSGHDMSMHSNPVTHQLMERARTLGSGTSILPQTSPMRMWSLETGDWLWMLHGDLVAGYNHQGGPRGAQTWAAENWAMGMLTGHLGPGILDLRVMGSLEALTLPPGGTPRTVSDRRNLSRPAPARQAASA
jgi:hypothetical protein